MLVIPLITQNKNSWEISTASLVMKGMKCASGEASRREDKDKEQEAIQRLVARQSRTRFIEPTYSVCFPRWDIKHGRLCRTFPTFWILSGVWFLHNNKITDRSKIIIFAAHLLLAPKCGLVPGGQYFPVEKNNTIRRRRERRWQCQEPHKIADNLVFIGDQRPNNLIRTDFIRRSVGCSTQTPSPPHKIENTL